MASETTYLLLDSAKRALRWLVWRPLRLVVAVIVIGALWIGLVRLSAVPGGSGAAPASSTQTAGVPSGWQTWPAVAATSHAPSQTSFPAPSASQTSSPAPSASLTPGVPTTPSAAVWDDASQVAALATGVRAVAAYTAGDQTGLDKMVGWDVAITVHARPVVINTPDPDMPGSPVPYIAAEDNPLSTVVVIPTSDGDYRVAITRWDGAGPWLVQTITEPAQ